jgi:tetratricopeptide (TPR) repeat protein
VTGHPLDQQYLDLKARIDRGDQLFQSDIADCLNFAVDANEEGRPDLTRSLLEPIAERAAKYPALWQLLGLAYRAEQSADLAHAAFQRASALAPQDAKIVAGHATTAFENGLPAAQLFRQARRIDPNNQELVLSASAALVAEGNGSAAIGLVVKEVGRFPEWVRGHQALSALRWTQGEPADRFARSFETAVALRPKDIALRLAWLREVLQTRDFEAVMAILAASRAAVGDRVEFDAVEAAVASEQGDTARAQMLFQKLQGFDDPSITLFRIRDALATGQPDQAEALANTLLGTEHAQSVWPYLSLIWRLTGDTKAQWLDGDPPHFRVFDLDFKQGELDALAACLRRLHVAKAQFLGQSVRGGTQTDGNLFLRHEPEIQAVRTKIVAAVRDYVSSLPPRVEGHPLLVCPRSQILFEGSWSVRLAGAGFHVAHTHTHGWISSALYVALPGAEALGARPAGWLRLGAPPRELGLDIPAYGHVEPQPGRLVLFPSTMWHETVPFGQGERLTIAFDMARPKR